MIDPAFAEPFARGWIEAWKGHDLERILSHYAEAFGMTSPVIREITGEPSGTLKGKAAVGAYWAKALTLISELRFDLITTLIGVNSIMLYYQGMHGLLAAEIFHFSPGRRVINAYAHYAPELVSTVSRQVAKKNEWHPCTGTPPFGLI